MPSLLANIIINMLSISIVAWVVPGIEAPSSFASLVVVALVFGIVNAILRPLLYFLSLPFIVVTLGLFVFVVNGFLLAIVAALTPLNISGFWAAVLGAIVMSVVNMALGGIFKEQDEKDYARR